MRLSSKILTAGARSSPLSRAQVEEVAQALRQQAPNWEIQPFLLDTQGDRDQASSLRTMDKTDFFTRELDEGVLIGAFRVAVHSAKDLPDPLTEGIVVAAITKGLTPDDSLVMREGFTLDSLPPGAKIGCSSERREAAIRLLRPDLEFVDIRGNIGQRLSLMDTQGLHGVVVAEAALLRLRLDHLNREPLKGPTVPLQGKLAITTRADDEEMIELFGLLHGK